MNAMEWLSRTSPFLSPDVISKVITSFKDLFSTPDPVKWDEYVKAPHTSNAPTKCSQNLIWIFLLVFTLHNWELLYLQTWQKTSLLLKAHFTSTTGILPLPLCMQCLETRIQAELLATPSQSLAWTEIWFGTCSISKELTLTYPTRPCFDFQE